MKGAKVKKAKQKTNNILAILTLCTLAITAIIIGQFAILDNTTNKILQKGTVINGYNLSGMNKDDAKVMLLNNFEEKAEHFTLTINEPKSKQSWKFDKNDFAINEDINPIFEVSQDKNSLLGKKEDPPTLISQFNKSGGAINVSFNYIFLGLDEKIEKIISDIEVSPKNSEIKFTDNNDNFEITESSNGLRVDKAKLYNDINEQFLTSNNINVDINLVEEVATITKDFNESITQKIASFTTNVADSTGGRKHNVKLALSKFDNMIIIPKQTISFNDIIGEHTIENGYKTATIIYNGEYTDGIGGGICQASTTLYNALLLSGLEINEVHKHSLPVKYVPLGLDAMVAEHTSDLKFTNNSNYPILINTYYDKNSVTVDIYSHPLEYTYKTRSEIISEIKSSGDKIVPDTDGKYSSKVLFKGEYFRVSYPKDGYEVKAYLQKYLGNEMIEEKEIRHEVYQAQKGVVIEGIEELPEGISPIDSGVEIIKNE